MAATSHLFLDVALRNVDQQMSDSPPNVCMHPLCPELWRFGPCGTGGWLGFDGLYLSALPPVSVFLHFAIFYSFLQ